jgi:hypothetical protein
MTGWHKGMCTLGHVRNNITKPFAFLNVNNLGKHYHHVLKQFFAGATQHANYFSMGIPTRFPEQFLCIMYVSWIMTGLSLFLQSRGKARTCLNGFVDKEPASSCMAGSWSVNLMQSSSNAVNNADPSKLGATLGMDWYSNQVSSDIDDVLGGLSYVQETLLIKIKYARFLGYYLGDNFYKLLFMSTIKYYTYRTPSCTDIT